MSATIRNAIGGAGFRGVKAAADVKHNCQTPLSGGCFDADMTSVLACLYDRGCVLDLLPWPLDNRFLLRMRCDQRRVGNRLKHFTIVG